MSALHKSIMMVLLLAGFFYPFRPVDRHATPAQHVCHAVRPRGQAPPPVFYGKADIPAIKARALGPCNWFYKKAKSDFGGYVSQRTPDAPGTWKDYLFGFWGQFSMCMFYLVEGDTAYANAARSWALFYAGRTDWLADDLVPMEITSGMALTYDILYDYLSPAQTGRPCGPRSNGPSTRSSPGSW
jgi:hypothetical protein